MRASGGGVSYQDANAREGSETPMAGAGFETLKALIVEDNAHMRSLLRALLNSAGIRHVAEAANGQAALILLRENKCDLVLSDLAMKPMDGLAFTRGCALTSTAPIPSCPSS